MPRAHRPTSHSPHVLGPNPTARRPLSKADKPRPVPVPLHADFSAAQAEQAVGALLAHQAAVDAKKEATELLGAEGAGGRGGRVYLVVNTKRGRTRAGGLKPVRIQLPHPPLPPPPASLVGLITKPPQRTYKDLLAGAGVGFVNRVVDTDKLRGKWRPFEARRNLCAENDVWLVDDRVVPSMPGLLGKVWFDAKKQPIPVNLQRKDLKAELGRAIAATYYIPNTGTSHSLRIASPTTDPASPAHTLANLLAALPQLLAHIEGGWDNVLSVGIKTGGSLLLPIWSAGLQGRFEKPAVEPKEPKAKAEKVGKALKGEKGEKEGAAKKGKDKADKMEVEEAPAATKKKGSKKPESESETAQAAKSGPSTAAGKSDNAAEPAKKAKTSASTLAQAKTKTKSLPGKEKAPAKDGAKKKSSTVGSGRGKVKKAAVGSA